MTVQRITCPACQASRFVHDDEGNLICEACGTKYASPREEIACRACGTPNPASARYCSNCSLQLGRTCPACSHANPPGNDHCEKCGSPLDVLSTLSARHQDQQFGNVDRRADPLIRSKSDDIQFLSDERRRLEEEERERITRILEQRERSKREQIIMISAVLGAIGVVLIVLVVVVILTGGN